MQLNASSSLQKQQMDTSRLEGVVENLNDELTESDRRLRSLQHELLQREEELRQSSADLKSSHEDCVSKCDEVFSCC